MSDEILFLPYLRRGLAALLDHADPLTGTLPREPELTASIDVEGRHIPRAVRLRGPGEALALGPGQVLRSEPRPDANDVEPNYFALVELEAPDFPWLLTPAAPNAKEERLRPWLVLVVVREQDGVSVTTRAGAPLPVLSIAAPAVPAQELPDLTDSWAWAHVQSLVPVEELESAVAAGSREVIARLVSPRHLQPSTRYVACVVPAFEEGRVRGLGGTPAASSTVAPAWTTAGLEGAASIELPVYHHWRFTTGEAGDFESLCRRLKPDGDGAEMGLHALDVTDPGLVRAAAGTVLVDMKGALHTVEAVPRPWPKTHRAAFQADLVPLLDDGIGRATFTPPARGKRYVPAIHDPVVTPPAYGAWPAGIEAVPAGGWVREINADPVPRAAAGLGARVVRTNQEALVAAAWEQAGDLRAAVAALGQGRLAAELGRSWAGRARTLADGDLLQLTVALHAILPGGLQSVRARLAASALPVGLVSAAYLRQTRPGTPLARDWQRRTARPAARLSLDHVETTIAATAGDDPQLIAARDFAVAGLPNGAQTSDPTLDMRPVIVGHADMDPVVLSGFEQTLEQRFTLRRSSARLDQDVLDDGPLDDGPFDDPGGPGGPVIGGEADATAIADDVRARLDPLPAVRAGVVGRFPALAGTLPPGALPTSVPPLGPVFPDALFWDLLALGSEWLLPGAGSLGATRIRLLAVDNAFVAALLIGADHELKRELLWRSYPVDVRATFFHRFWEYLDEERIDLGDLHPNWSKPDALARSLLENASAEQKIMTAIVARGDVIRRYPSAHWFLQPAQMDRNGVRSPVEDTIVEVSFLGSLDAQTGLYGFDLEPDYVRGKGTSAQPGYYVGIEEAPGEARFGLDPEKAGHFGDHPRSWDRASWGHLTASQEELDALSHARATGTELDGLELDRTVWGKNAAHIARATWQRPFRMLIHAELLI